MLKKFLEGILFGSGFAVAFAAVTTLYVKFFFIDAMNAETHRTQTPPVTRAPAVDDNRQGHLGSVGAYNGDFQHDRSRTLAPGEGRIEGVTRANGNPVEGVKLRLALNGEVISQWGITDADGVYSISVPYGKYRIDGYELNKSAADQALAGLIKAPRQGHSSGVFHVTADTPGTGITLDFIKPVVKLTKGETFAAGGPAVVSWEPYKGAAGYRLQIHEKVGPHKLIGNERLFSWQERPVTADIRLDVSTVTDNLKSGYYYVYDVHAYDDNGDVISESPNSHLGYDFTISGNK